MEYRKIDKSSYNLHLIKTENFKTIFFKFVFRDNIKKEDITIRNFLTEILASSSKKYPTTRFLSIRQEELYNLTMNFSNRRIGSQILSELCFSIIDSKYTDEQSLEESIAFMADIIFNPNIENNLFNEKMFNITYDYLKERIEELKNNPDYYAESSIKQIMCKDNAFSFNLTGYMNDLEKITRENLTEYYYNFINKNILDIFVVGNIDFYEIEKLIDKYIVLKVLKKPKKQIQNYYESNRKRAKMVQEESNFSQSKLLIGCQIKNPTEKERKYTAVLYNMILGNSPESKLFKNIREKKSLAYDVSSSYYKNDNIILIKTGINKNSYEDALKGIKKEIKDITLGKFSMSHLDNCKTLIKSLLNEFTDYQGSIAEYYFSLEYLDQDTINIKEKMIDSITKDDIINVSKKVVIDTIYFLKEK